MPTSARSRRRRRGRGRAVADDPVVATPRLEGRHMFIWRLAPVLTVEQGAERLADKAQAARLSSVWIKIAVGKSPYTDNLTPAFDEVRDALEARGIAVWGWHEPRCKTAAVATEEAALVARIAIERGVKGVLMDAETPQGNFYFQGKTPEATTYAKSLRERLDEAGLGLAICSHDIPQNFPVFPFDELARHAHINAPQVYYGSSSSVGHRLERAIRANAHLTVPFVPVGAGWVGDAGGCASASACAERALALIHLVHEKEMPGYSFWHWAGAPMDLWKVLFETEV